MFLLAGLGWLAHDGELVDSRDCGASECAVDRLPADPIFADTGDDIRGRCGFAILSHPIRFDQPSIAVAREVPLAEAALGVEDPGLELVLHRVPADALGAGENRLALGLHGEFADQEIAVGAPLASGVDDCVLALVDPVSDQPFQLLEAVVGGQVVGVLVADGRLEPVAIVLDVDDREASDLRRPASGRGDGGLALLERRVGAEETQ